MMLENATDTISLIKDLVGMAAVPAAIWAYKLQTEMTKLKEGQQGIKESNTKEHAHVCELLKEVKSLIATSEKDNRDEHRALGDKIVEIDKRNSVEHAILSQGGKL